MGDFEKRLKKLSPKKKALLAKQIGLQNEVAKDESLTENQRLVAYFTADKSLSVNDLHGFLKNKLPNYMIPSNFVQIEKFPKLPNGKIDVNSLQFFREISIASDSKFVAPKNEIEEKLVKIWEEMLNVEPIGTNENFFEIGGDSILSIQIVAKARKEGIKLSPNQIFEHQTIAELAIFAETERQVLEQEIVVGDFTLLPIQRWFFEEHKKAPHYWNQAVKFNVPKDFNALVFKKCLEKLIVHHDSLRMRFESSSGEWGGVIVDPVGLKAFAEFDLQHLSQSEIDLEITKKLLEFQNNLNLSESQLFQAIYFKCRRDLNDRLFLIAHHLLVDNVSWQILLADLESFYVQLKENSDISLPAKTTSYKKWSEELQSSTEKFKGELDFWKTQKSVQKIPRDFETSLPINEKSVKTLEVIIDKIETSQLLENANEAYNTKADELLIVAIISAFEGVFNVNEICLGLEKHGRGLVENDLDLSNTVGWFTSYFPVLLKSVDSAEMSEKIVSIKEKLRNVPNDGLGYGILRYLQSNEHLNQQPEIIFNYLGKQKTLKSEVFGKGEFLSEKTRSDVSERNHLLEINSFVEADELKIIFSFSERLHRLETIKSLAETFELKLREIIEFCLKQDAEKYTPSDFPEADLNQEDLDNLFNQLD